MVVALGIVLAFGPSASRAQIQNVVIAIDCSAYRLVDGKWTALRDNNISVNGKVTQEVLAGSDLEDPRYGVLIHRLGIICGSPDK